VADKDISLTFLQGSIRKSFFGLFRECNLLVHDVSGEVSVLERQLIVSRQLAWFPHVLELSECEGRYQVVLR